MLGNDENGFGIFEALIVFVMLTIIACAGYFITTHHNNESVADSNNSNSISQSKKLGITATRYLVIKDWGVKLPLSSNILDLYYVVSSGSEDSNSQPNTMWFGLKSIVSTSCTPTPSNTNNTELASILRVSPNATDPISGEALTSKFPNGKTLGGYYYALNDGRTIESDCATQAQLQSIDTALKVSVKNIVTDPSFVNSPILGESWAPYQQGYRTVEPSEISNGGDSTGTVTNLTWQSWGGSQAKGQGTSTYVAANDTVSQGTQAKVTVVAFDLGTCQDKAAYTAIEWYFPEYGGSFNPNSYRNICTGKEVGQ